MNTHKVDSHFKKIGSHVVVREPNGSRGNRHSNFFRENQSPFAIDIAKDRKGKEYFDVVTRDPTTMTVLDVQPDDQHLLLMIRSGDTMRKFLCGFDERGYFAAGVNVHARDVMDAKRLLMPQVVRERASELHVTERFTRRNRLYKRQGEWFFVPVKLSPEPDKLHILHNEPLQRGNSKPHMAQELYRVGGQMVYFDSVHAPNGVTDAEYEKLRLAHRGKRDESQFNAWRRMMRDPIVHARGAIHHPDHATLVLVGWHRVYPNDEVLSREMRFLD